MNLLRSSMLSLVLLSGCSQQPTDGSGDGAAAPAGNAQATEGGCGAGGACCGDAAEGGSGGCCADKAAAKPAAGDDGACCTEAPAPGGTSMPTAPTRPHFPANTGGK